MNADNDNMGKEWIRKGDHDLGTARITLMHIPEYLDTIVFHCQQAVEKYLKAFLIFQSISFRFTHDLVYLLELTIVKSPELIKYFDKIAELQSYAVEVRYPNQTVYLSIDKVVEAFMLAREIRRDITTIADIKVDYHGIIDENLDI